MPALRALLSQKQLSCGRCAGAGASACGRWARCAPMSLCWRVCTYVCTYVGTGQPRSSSQHSVVSGGGLEFIEHQGRVAFLLLPGLLQGPSWHRRQAAAWPWGVSVCASCHPLRPHPGSEVHCAPPSLPASPRRCCQRPPHVWTCVLAQPSRPRTCSDFCARLSRRALVTPLGSLLAAWFAHVSTPACPGSCVGGPSGFPCGRPSARAQSVLGVHVRARVWGTGVERPGNAALFSEVVTPDDRPPAARAEPVTRGGSAQLLLRARLPRAQRRVRGARPAEGLAGAGGSVAGVLGFRTRTCTRCACACISSASRITWGDYVGTFFLKLLVNNV